MTQPTKQTTCVTAAWLRHDTYELTIPVRSRWKAFKNLIKGCVKIRWQVPYNAKRKGIYIKGNKVDFGIIVQEDKDEKID